MIEKNKIKHVWDPAAGEFLPEKKKVQPIRKLWAGVRSWPWIHQAAAIAAILRTAQVWAAAFWYDEGVTVVLARLPWDRMIAATAGDVHPPGYYIILWILARTGIPLTETTARIPSILLSVAAVYMAAALAERLDVNKKGQIIIIAWIIISPLQLHYAQEARMYALLQAEVLLSILLMINQRRAFLTMVLTAMLYTHNYAVFYIPSIALAALVTDGIQWRTIKHTYKKYLLKWLPWFIIPVLAWTPWIIVLAKQMGTVSAGYWIQPVTPAAVIFVAYQMLFAYSMPLPFQGIAVLVTCGLLLYTAWRIYQDRPPYYKELIVLAAGPLFLAVVASITWRPVLLFRGLIGTAIPLTILVVKAIEGISLEYKKYYAYFIIGITLIAGVVGHYLYNPENKGLTTTWVHEIETEFKQGDVILSLNDNGIIAVKTYADQLPLFKLEGCGEEALGSLSYESRAALDIQEISIEELIGTLYSYNRKTIYTRIWFISTVAPVSPQCEIDAAEHIINSGKYRVKIIKELANNTYTQAGIYLITSKEIY